MSHSKIPNGTREFEMLKLHRNKRLVHVSRPSIELPRKLIHVLPVVIPARNRGHGTLGRDTVGLGNLVIPDHACVGRRRRLQMSNAHSRLRQSTDFEKIQLDLEKRSGTFCSGQLNQRALELICFLGARENPRSTEAGCSRKVRRKNKSMIPALFGCVS